MAKTRSTQHAARSTKTSGKYIEIVNWRKAQPRMKDGPNAWMKLYTSLLDHDGFGGMNDSARMLLIGLWLYAARTGHYILPADPKWLHRKIPMLHAEPNFKPLLEAKDIFGKPTPFLQYCDHPQAKKAKDREFEGSKEAKEGKEKEGTARKDGAEKPAKPKKTRRAQKPGTDVATRAHARSRESRAEESRAEQKRVEPSTLTGFGKEKEERKTLSGFSREESRAEQTTATADQTTAEPDNPMNPKESEAEGATKHIVPTPPRSVSRAGPQAIGQIINARFPEHWQDPDAEAFGWEIIKALGLPRDEHNMEIRSEWGAFAKWWSDVKHAAPAMMLGELRAMAIGKAIWIHSGPKKPKHVRNPRALWTNIMAKELVHHGITLPPARASPQVKVHA